MDLDDLLIDCLFPTETDDDMRSFAEMVFATEVKDEGERHEISPFDVADICPISHHEMQDHMINQENTSASDKRLELRICPESLDN